MMQLYLFNRTEEEISERDEDIHEEEHSEYTEDNHTVADVTSWGKKTSAPRETLNQGFCPD